MHYAARPLGHADAPWLCPGDVHVVIGPVACTQTWLAGLSNEEAEAQGLERAEVAGTPPIDQVRPTPVIAIGEGGLRFDWSPDGAASLRALRISQIKAEANQRILARYNLVQQANMNMRATEIVDLRQDRALTDDEEVERTSLKNAAAWIKSVRAASNSIEASLPADVEGLAAFDAAKADWPA